LLLSLLSRQLRKRRRPKLRLNWLDKRLRSKGKRMRRKDSRPSELQLRRKKKLDC
jgi:hypothetical protein